MKTSAAIARQLYFDQWQFDARLARDARERGGEMAKGINQKPHKWNRNKDAQRCVACDKDFVKGDLVYTDCAVNIHFGCVRLYMEQEIELGLKHTSAR